MSEELISIKNRLDKILNSGKEPVYCEELITTGELQKLLEEIERLNKELNFERQIKKEVREYIKEMPNNEYIGYWKKEIFEILDKVEEK